MCGRKVPFITAAVARLTYELMIEQERQEQIAIAEARKTGKVPDAMLQAAQPGVYRWVKSGWIGVKF